MEEHPGNARMHSWKRMLQNCAADASRLGTAGDGCDGTGAVAVASAVEGDGGGTAGIVGVQAAGGSMAAAGRMLAGGRGGGGGGGATVTTWPLMATAAAVAAC